MLMRGRSPFIGTIDADVIDTVGQGGVLSAGGGNDYVIHANPIYTRLEADLDDGNDVFEVSPCSF